MAATYEFDPRASLLSLDGRSTVHPIHAETDGLAGWIRGRLADTGQATIEAGRIEIPLTSLSSANALYDAELRRRIDVRRYPTALGVLSEWLPTPDPGTYRVRGAITFRGVTRTVESTMTLTVEQADTVVLSGSCALDIRDYGMTPPRLLALRVYPEVTVRVAIVGRRA